MIITLWRFAKELFFFSSIGALIGAGICFIMFLHLGSPKTPEDAGYVVGLFVKSGVQLGLIFWIVRESVKSLRRYLSTHRKKRPTEPRLPDGKSASDNIASSRKQRRFAALVRPWD